MIHKFEFRVKDNKVLFSNHSIVEAGLLKYMRMFQSNVPKVRLTGQ